MSRAFSPYSTLPLKPGALPQADMEPRLRRYFSDKDDALEFVDRAGRSANAGSFQELAPKARSISAWGNAPGQ
jgi:hypothetical protein